MNFGAMIFMEDDYYNCKNCGFTHTNKIGCSPSTIEYSKFAEEIAKLIYKESYKIHRIEDADYTWGALEIANKITILIEKAKKENLIQTKKWKNAIRGSKFIEFECELKEQ